VTRSVFTMALLLRLRSTLAAAAGLVVVLVIVGALFPAVGESIGKLDLPQGVADLLGGADYGTITGWYRSEIGSLYGPLVVAALAITGAVSTTAGEEEAGILSLVLAHPVRRSRMVAAKGCAIAGAILMLAVATCLGLIVGVALGGGGIGIRHLAAFSVHLAFFGFAIGAVALAVGAATGQRALAAGVGAAVAVAGWMINGFAPLVDALDWLKYLSLFYYYAGNDPLAHGVDPAHLGVLAVVALVSTAAGMAAIQRRDLRA
jgi:beta-exotoxin I transport system permease protein